MFISSFTPGPSNISTAASGVLHGYKNTLSFQTGLAVGGFLIMFLSGLVSVTLIHLFPALEPLLRYVGAAYILYLAYGILKASYNFTMTDAGPMGFFHGLALRVLNPKLLVYAFTVFTGFLASIADNPLLIALVALTLAIISFAATSVWALCGTVIKTYLYDPLHIKLINLLLALALVYSALTLVGMV